MLFGVFKKIGWNLGGNTMIKIKCIIDDCGNEYLPDFTETELWTEVNEFSLTKCQIRI